MRISPIVLLLVAIVGCSSGTQPAKPSAESGGDQAQQQKVSTPKKQVATPTVKVAAAKRLDVATVKKAMTPDQLALGDPIVNSVGMILVPIPAGEFQMGSPDSERAAQDDEKPQHLVKITKPFYMSACEVTQQQYEKVMGVRPWQGKRFVQEGPDYAAAHLSWIDSVKFCRKLSEQEGVDYHLPTEAEWEYACRAGTTTAYSFGDDRSQLGQYAWFSNNSWGIGEKYPHRVGRKLPNTWGLYDMHGNVWEWCQDWYAPYGSEKILIDPKGPTQINDNLRKYCVMRGSVFSYPAVRVRSACRFRHTSATPWYTFGFRPSRTYP